jgi:hypothetical protein
MSDEVPIIEPTGFNPLVKRKLAELVAETTAFQNRCEVASQAEAFSRIYWPFLRNADQFSDLDRPFALIESPARGAMIWKRLTGYDMRPEGSVCLMLTDWDKYPQFPEVSNTDFENFTCGVIEEIAGLQAQNDRLAIEIITEIGPSQLTSPKAAGQGKPYWSQMFDVKVSRL